MITYTAKTFNRSKLAILEHRNRKHVKLQYPVRLDLIAMETVTNTPDHKILSCVLGWLYKFN
jgi:hypothetical protein